MNSDTEIAWSAGFFDGEGCIVVGTNGSLQVRIINTSLKSLERIRNTFGIGTIKQRNQKINKTQYYWSSYGAEAGIVLETMLPYLSDKVLQSICAIKYYQSLKDISGRSKEAIAARKQLTEKTRKRLTELKLKDD